MDELTLYQIDTYILVSILFVVLIIVYFSGVRFKNFLSKLDKSIQIPELGVVEGSLLGLFAFFLGFSFNLAGSRFDNRRQTIVNEANSIRTAIFRADLFPDSIRAIMRNHFQLYVDHRIVYYNSGFDQEKIKKALQESTLEANKIWTITSQLVANGKYPDASRQMIPALNNMIDAVSMQDAVRIETIPESIIWVLFLLSICSSFIVGYGTKMGYKNYVAGFILILMFSIAIFLILDLDKPRRGLITTRNANNKIFELRLLFNQ